MGSVKNFIKGTLDPIGYAKKREARKQEEEARKEAERLAQIEAANKAALEQGQAETIDTVDFGGASKQSDQKKKLKGGRKGLTVTRTGGTGINI